MSPTATRTAHAALNLAEHVSGSVVLPGDAGWEAARQAWNVAVEQHPALVVFAQCVGDVAAAVRFAAASGLRVAVQGTGHGAPARVPIDESVLLLRMDRLDAVEVDTAGRRCRAEGGALWGAVTERAAPRGLAALHGSSPDVGVVGYTLGGGIGWLARKHGLASNSVLAMEVVLADGSVVRASAEEHADLFWALRGGGGSFGVVTAIEFALYPVESVYAGWLMWPWERAGEVLHAWRQWARTAPDEVTSVGRILQLPPIPEIPEPMRGRQLVVIEAAFLGDYDEAIELFWPLRRLQPEMDTFAMQSAAALGMLHQDPQGPTPGIGDGFLLDELPAEAIDAFVAATGPGSGSPLVSAELRHLGGALRRAAPGAGALPTLDGEFACFAVGVPIAPEIAEALEHRLDVMADALAPWQAARAYRNFAERRVHARTFNGAATYRRLQAIRGQYDPQQLFQPVHEVTAA
jgi:FAD/FMN-containing dehydrogenase